MYRSAKGGSDVFRRKMSDVRQQDQDDASPQTVNHGAGKGKVEPIVIRSKLTKYDTKGMKTAHHYIYRVKT